MRSQNAWPTSCSIASPTGPAAWGLALGCVQPKPLNISAGAEVPSMTAFSQVNAALQGRRDPSLQEDELDAWLEQYREEPREQETLRVPSGAGRRPLRPQIPPRAGADARGAEGD
jgi:hypothetical protein